MGAYDPQPAPSAGQLEAEVERLVLEVQQLEEQLRRLVDEAQRLEVTGHQPEMIRQVEEERLRVEQALEQQRRQEMDVRREAVIARRADQTAVSGELPPDHAALDTA